MVGLVVVSHSRALAEAVCRLATGVGQADLPVAFAGGAGEGYAELGTDATDIVAAIRAANRGDGVVVLTDLGSALISARMAVEMLEGESVAIRLCSAPLVEGAVAAAVQISVDAPVEAVCREAENSLRGKQAEIDDAPSLLAAGPDETVRGAGDGETRPPDDALRFRFTLADPNGMHLRPAAALVKCLAAFACAAGIRDAGRAGAFANAKSLNQVALADIRGGAVAELALWGRDADQALAAVRRLVAETLHGGEIGETGGGPVSAASAPDAAPVILSPGVATGRLHIASSRPAATTPGASADPVAELARFDGAVAAARSDLAAQRETYAGLPAEAAILEVQELILDDADILAATRRAIREERLEAGDAYLRRMADLADAYRKSANPTLRNRAADIEGVAETVAAALAGGDGDAAAKNADIVLWAGEVTPALIGRFPPPRLRAILTRDGAPASHVAILARALGIPAVAGVLPPAGAGSGTVVTVDTERLEVVFAPTPAQSGAFARRLDQWRAELAEDVAASAGPALTRDGVRVAVLANVGNSDTATAARADGAEGIGVLRTEFLFLNRVDPPDEEEQAAALRQTLALFAGMPAVVRTLDAGGDKAMPWLALGTEANPFLGVRGIRISQRMEDLFRAQLRAILCAGVDVDLGVMIPMVAEAAEIGFARNALDAAHADLERRGVPHAWPVRFGVMVETPAAVLMADRFSRLVDFLSIGTNDLAQYVMCAERGAAALAGLADPFQPAVLRAVRAVAAAAGAAGIEVDVCGEMAGDPAAARALVGLGIARLSMNPSSIGGVKRVIRRSETKELEKRALSAMNAASAAEARRIVMDGLE